MGMMRPDDPYGLTTTLRIWPEVDEDLLTSCQQAFQETSTSVASRLDAARGERSTIFDGVGIWSGAAAGTLMMCPMTHRRPQQLRPRPHPRQRSPPDKVRFATADKTIATIRIAAGNCRLGGVAAPVAFSA